jgi:hypothetical protein
MSWTTAEAAPSDDEVGCTGSMTHSTQQKETQQDKYSNSADQYGSDTYDCVSCVEGMHVNNLHLFLRLEYAMVQRPPCCVLLC